jgi:hypothetical protein
MTTPQNQIAIQGVTVASADYLNTLTQWVPTLSALRSFVGTGNMAVVLLGLSAPNDGGQSVFYWNPTSTAPDDGTNIVRPQGVTLGAWIRAGIIPGTGNPVQFLASGSTTNAVCQINYVASGAATLVLKPTTQATSACTLEAFAYGGAITLQLAAGTDRINGGTAGASLVVPQGYTADIWNDGAGNYYVILMLGTAATNVVTSWNGRNGVVTMTAADITGAGGALAASSVSSFNTRTGAVTLTTADVTGAGGAPLASPGLTGTPTSPTPAVNDNTTNVATTAYVQGQGSNAVPLMDGTAAAGTALTWTRGDHIHPTDTSRAPIASPTFTGTPTAPTQTAGDNSTNLATTAFVTTAINSVPPGATVAVSTTPPTLPIIGDLWWDTNGGNLYVWYNDGTSTQWVPATNQPGAASITASATPPASPQPNALWWDSVGGQLYVWYNDGTSTQWVVANNTQAGVASFNSRQGAVTLTPADVRAASMGVIDGSNAAAGQIGEYLTNTNNTPVGVANNTFTTLTSLLLPAGDWDVSGNSNIIASGATGLTAIIVAITTTVNAGPSAFNAGPQHQIVATFNPGGAQILPVQQCRFSFAVTTTLYFNVYVSFTGISAYNCQGFIAARRVR